MTQFTAWSYSRYAAWYECPLRAKLRFLDKIPVPQAPAMKRGDEVHRSTAEYINKQFDTPPAVVVSPFQRDLLKLVREFDDKVVEIQWGFTQKWEATGWFSGDTWLRTILDAALLYEDMTAEVIDWKTGKVYGSNEDQMELFGISLFCKFKPATHVTTRLVYFDAKTEQTAEYDRKDLDKMIAKWNAKVEPMLADTTFLPKPGHHCGRCDFSKSKGGQCRFG